MASNRPPADGSTEAGAPPESTAPKSDDGAGIPGGAGGRASLAAQGGEKRKREGKGSSVEHAAPQDARSGGAGGGVSSLSMDISLAPTGASGACDGGGAGATANAASLSGGLVRAASGGSTGSAGSDAARPAQRRRSTTSDGGDEVCEPETTPLDALRSDNSTPSGVADAAPAAPGVPIKCKKPGCMFFGSAEREGYCSACFKGVGGQASSGAAAAAPAAPAAVAASGPTKCKDAACAFFGSPAHAGYCSACYKKNHGAAAPPATAAVAAPQESAGGAGGVPASGAAAEGAKPVPKRKNRCGSCRKKLGIMGIVCRCGVAFCDRHHAPGDHECSYDHRTRHKEVLSKSNIAVKADSLRDRL